MASAAQQARTAWSSCGLGVPNNAMMPSPCTRTTEPSKRRTASLHRLDGGRQAMAGLLGIEALDQRGRSGDIGEQDGDLLEFATVRRLGGGDEGIAALRAKARPGGVDEAA